MNNVTFNNTDREEWMRLIQQTRENAQKTKLDDVFDMIIEKNVKAENFEPFHIVKLSCLIQELKNKGFSIRLNIKDENLHDFIYKNVNIKSYWINQQANYIPSPVYSDLNLWRIVDAEKDAYSISVHDYFQRHYFKDKDLSALKTSLNELYANVFDHANAQGNAFSYINYDKTKRKINIAICDFGIGVACSLRNVYGKYNNDEEALKDSIIRGVSARSQKHNRGWGLDNILSTLSDDNLFRLVSNKALMLIEGGKQSTKMIKLDFEFKGTLIYFDISIDKFPNKDETFENFSWNDDI